MKALLATSLFVLTASAIVIQSDSNENEVDLVQVNKAKCPNYQLKCPDCPAGQQCVYPESGGCEGAGIPVCQTINCHGIVCLMRSLPCPDECPFSCKYNGPSCCPFIGEPICEPVCQTFAPCHVTKCPEECPGDCFYPEADFCCPHAGKAICNKDKWILSENPFPTITASTPTNSRHHGSGYKSGDSSEIQGFYDDYNGHDGQEKRDEKRYEYGNDYYLHNHYNPYNGYGHGGYYGEYDNEYYGDNHHQHRHHKHHHDDAENCPICIKTVTDISVQVEFVTTTRSEGPIICAQYIIPCPAECPTNCTYPTHLPCPFTHQPWCPNVVQTEEEESCEYVYNTEGYPIPYFPTYDPFHTIFMSILNRSGVTSTPSYVTVEPTATPNVLCPLIFKYCPPECPDTCIRQNVPCPFAEDGYCPSNELSSTITTDVFDTVSLAPTICPMYMLACPYCPQGFSCTRDMIGYCPNTNVPYCVSTSSHKTQPSETVFEYYPDMMPEPTAWYDGWNYKLRAMAVAKDSESDKNTISQDACAEIGLARIENELVFKQIQETQSDCSGCPLLKFDESCDHTCVYFTEESCCLQMKCLSM